MENIEKRKKKQIKVDKTDKNSTIKKGTMNKVKFRYPPRKCMFFPILVISQVTAIAKSILKKNSFGRAPSEKVRNARYWLGGNCGSNVTSTAINIECK